MNPKAAPTQRRMSLYTPIPSPTTIGTGSSGGGSINKLPYTPHHQPHHHHGLYHQQHYHQPNYTLPGWGYIPHPYPVKAPSGGPGTPSSVGAALDELMGGGRTDGNLSSASSTVSPNSVYTNCSSVLKHDLNISEDSDVDLEGDDTQTSASQSKKGKVMNHTQDKPMSSSSGSSSSSDQSSESAGEEDDDDDDGEKKRGKKEASSPQSSKSNAKESRLSSSSSSSGSDSSSDSDSDDQKSKGAKGGSRGAKSISPGHLSKGDRSPSPGGGSRPASATVEQESSESKMSWCLSNFQPPKSKASSISPPTARANSSSPDKPSSASSQPTSGKNSPKHSPSPPAAAPARASPSPPPSPPPSAGTEERHRTLGEIGSCSTMSFEVSRKEEGEGDEGDERNEDEDEVDNEIKDDSDEEEEKVVQKKRSPLPKKVKDSFALKSKPSKSSEKLKEKKEKSSNSSSSSRKSASFDSKQGAEHSEKDISAHKKHLLKKNSEPNHSQGKPRKSSSAPSSVQKERPTPTSARALTPEERKSSDLEVDVVNVTPEKKLSVHQLPNGTLSAASDDAEHSESPSEKRQRVERKRDRRRSKSGKSKPSSSSTKSSSVVAEPQLSVVVDKKSAMDHLESMSKPPNLLSPFDSSDCSPPPGASRKPLPSFRTSFSPAPVSSHPPTVTLARTKDGQNVPQIVVQVRSEFITARTLQRLRERKERRARKSDKTKDSVEDVKSDLDHHSPLPPPAATESRVPPILSPGHSAAKESSSLSKHESPPPGRTNSSNSSSSVSHSSGSSSSKSGKRKNPDSSSSHEPPDGGGSTSSSSSSHPKVSKSSKVSKESLPPPASGNGKSSKGSSAVKDLSDFPPHEAPASASYTADSKETKASLVNKRKAESQEAQAAKKLKQENAQDNSIPPSIKADPEVTPALVKHRRDSTASTSSRSSQRSNSSKKSHKSSSSTNAVNKVEPKSEESASQELTNGPVEPASQLPFNNYVNGNHPATTPNTRTAAGLPANLPEPPPLESRLQGHEHYIARAKEHKHHADNLKDKLAKFEPYLRSGSCFYLAGYCMEQKQSSYTMYNETSNLLQYVIRMRANSSANADAADREKILLVLIIRLRAFVNHRMFHMKKGEVSKLKSYIESEQQNKSSKPHHLPSPHQSSTGSSWNKNSTGTPSSMSPTPSPAGSVSSQGSCELPPGKLTNGTSSSSGNLTSPSPGMVSLQQKMQRYFLLTSHLVKAMELWDWAQDEARGLEDFFSVVDSACGPLDLSSQPPGVVRYIKHSLELLHLAHPQS